jgi:hypothetical protein
MSPRFATSCAPSIDSWKADSNKGAIKPKTKDEFVRSEMPENILYKCGVIFENGILENTFFRVNICVIYSKNSVVCFLQTKLVEGLEKFHKCVIYRVEQLILIYHRNFNVYTFHTQTYEFE